MVCRWVAFHENDKNDEDNSDSYKWGVECRISGNYANHLHVENCWNSGCKPLVPQTTGLERPDSRNIIPPFRGNLQLHRQDQTSTEGVSMIRVHSGRHHCTTRWKQIENFGLSRIPSGFDPSQNSIYRSDFCSSRTKNTQQRSRTDLAWPNVKSSFKVTNLLCPTSLPFFWGGGHFIVVLAKCPALQPTAPDPKTHPSHIRTASEPHPNHIQAESEPTSKTMAEVEGEEISNNI